jgi:hypothetical protein
MRNKILSVLFFVSTTFIYGQAIADSTIKGMADFNCKCQDTININNSEEIITEQLRDCYTKSMVTYLNKGDLTPQILGSDKTLNSLQEKVFAQLDKCLKTQAIASKFNNEPVPISNKSDCVFIKEEFFKKHGLKKEQVEDDFIVWNNEKNDKIQRVVDIRWVFATHEEALKYHELNLKENSENGQEIKLKSTFTGVEELHVYKESKEMENMIKSMNLPQRQHYFIFVKDNMVYKIFVATIPSINTEDVKFIADEAIRQSGLCK